MKMDLSTLQFGCMQLSDLDEVMAIEQAVYSHPWGRVSFMDTLNNKDDAWVLRTVEGEMLGYVVLMAVVDEAHLLTLAVKGAMQRQGLGKLLLGFAVQQATRMHMQSMLLEVRVSNLHALRLYQSFGFELIARRKNYYQSDQKREDALILRYDLRAKDNKHDAE